MITRTQILKNLTTWTRWAMATTLLVSAASCSSNNATDDTAAQCAPKFEPLKEFLVVEPSVVDDARSLNATAGPWSFRHMIENMVPAGKTPSAFVTEWLHTWIDQTEYNGQPLDLPSERRNDTMMSLIICPWLKRTPANACDTNCGTCSDHTLDMAQAPFRLIAISNRMDERKPIRMSVPAPNGEGRFVYALTLGAADDRESKPAPMTVIFEYALPVTRTVKQWAESWHQLGTHPAFDESYKADLENLTNMFSVRGAAPDRPLGNAIAQVRTNESVLNWIWQLREFQLQSGQLVVHGTANTPFDALNSSDKLAGWAKENSAAIKSGKFSVPQAFLGGSASQFLFTWSLPGVDEDTRRGFASQTCSGCHTGDVPGQNRRDVAFHVSPFGEGAARLSPFVYDPEHKFSDPTKKDALTLRGEDMQSILCEP
jgi:hypothetical protein